MTKPVPDEKGEFFADYLTYLRESMDNLEEYWQKTGYNDPHIKNIRAGLHHCDPFIIYKASLAATMLLEEHAIYH